MNEARKRSEHPSSFRDPAGALYFEDEVLYRFLSENHLKDFQLLKDSGLLEILYHEGSLVVHHQVHRNETAENEKGIVLRPELIPFISYPYEWSFSALKEAALLTLSIQIKALEHGMTLKDASAFNVQFVGTKPVFIDILSFEKYIEGRPWIAYRQFCEHFLAPLTLMSHCDIQLQSLLQVHLDGIPIDLASKLLPVSTYLKFGHLMHIHLNGLAKKTYEGQSKVSQKVISKQSLLGILDSLTSTVRAIHLPKKKSTWSNYYQEFTYSKESISEKAVFVGTVAKKITPYMVWDLGGNTGKFSEIASKHSSYVICSDNDPYCVDQCFIKQKQNNSKTILPLYLEVDNPTSGRGVEHRERFSLSERGPCELLLALALTHHLSISDGIPFSKIASQFSKWCKNLIVEYVGLKDEQTIRLLATREKPLEELTKDRFESAFSEFFEIVESKSLSGSDRTIYWMRSK